MLRRLKVWWYARKLRKLVRASVKTGWYYGDHLPRPLSALVEQVRADKATGKLKYEPTEGESDRVLVIPQYEYDTEFDSPLDPLVYPETKWR